MDINDAVGAVEKFLTKYSEDHDNWNPTEIRVLPSGDEKDAIKVWLNFGPDTVEAELGELKSQCADAFAKAHPDIDKEYSVEIRADAM